MLRKLLSFKISIWFALFLFIVYVTYNVMYNTPPWQVSLTVYESAYFQAKENNKMYTIQKVKGENTEVVVYRKGDMIVIYSPDGRVDAFSI